MLAGSNRTKQIRFCYNKSTSLCKQTEGNLNYNRPKKLHKCILLKLCYSNYFTWSISRNTLTLLTWKPPKMAFLTHPYQLCSSKFQILLRNWHYVNNKNPVSFIQELLMVLSMWTGIIVMPSLAPVNIWKLKLIKVHQLWKS